MKKGVECSTIDEVKKTGGKGVRVIGNIIGL